MVKAIYFGIINGLIGSLIVSAYRSNERISDLAERQLFILQTLSELYK